MKDFFFTNIKKYRFEHKFLIADIPEHTIHNIINFHPAIFRKIYHPRWVNSIYFDSVNLDHYLDNIEGMGRRLKVRIRWYEEKFGLIKNPVLELKLKEGQYVGKQRYSLDPFNFDSLFSIHTIQRVFEKSSLPPLLREYLKELNLSVFIHYHRTYFLSCNQVFRLTLDKDVEVYQLSHYQNLFLKKSIDRDSLVLELKCDTACKKSADDITRHLPFRLSKNSKYVTGIDSVM